LFERFTERARRNLFFARYEATEFGSLSIDTEHLLLGLIRDGHGLIAAVFANWQLSLKEMRQRIESGIEHRGKIATSIEIPFSADAKRALEFAKEEADRLLHADIGSQHLLLGILRVEQSLPARLMNEAGMTIDALRDFLARMEDPEITAVVGTAVSVSTLAYTIGQLQMELADLRRRVEMLEGEVRRPR
jgi:ATP-dependent Clp protease ATP-binding subunit ClpC